MLMSSLNASRIKSYRNFEVSQVSAIGLQLFLSVNVPLMYHM